MRLKNLYLKDLKGRNQEAALKANLILDIHQGLLILKINQRKNHFQKNLLTRGKEIRVTRLQKSMNEMKDMRKDQTIIQANMSINRTIIKEISEMVKNLVISIMRIQLKVVLILAIKETMRIINIEASIIKIGHTTNNMIDIGAIMNTEKDKENIEEELKEIGKMMMAGKAIKEKTQLKNN